MIETPKTQARRYEPRACTLAELAPYFAEPRPLSRPVPFWLINAVESVSQVEIERQLLEFHRQGMDTICILPAFFADGIYLQERWWQVLRWITHAATRLNMTFWVQDDNYCPSGSVMTTLPQTPEFRSLGMQCHRLAVSEGEAIPAGPNTLAAFEVQDMGMCQIDPVSWRCPQTAGEPTEMIVIAVGETPGRQGGHRLAQGFGRGEVNRLDDEATQRFIAETHEKYADHLGSDTGTRLTGNFTDEPAIFEPPGWSRDLMKEFTRRKGYDLTPVLPALWMDLGPATPRYRHDYHEVVTALCIERFSMRQQGWCAEHGLLYSRHLWENWVFSLNAGVFWQPDPLRTLVAMDAPGAGKLPASEIKFASSAAHLADRPRMLVEAFAGCGYTINFEQLKWMLNWMFATGIDLLVSHVYYYTIEGAYLVGPQPTLFWQTPQWRYHHLFGRYVGRASELLQAGTHVAHIAVLYPTASVWAETVYPCGVWPKPPMNRPPVVPGLQKIQESVSAVTSYLTERQVDYDLVDETALAEARLEKGALLIGEERYQAVVLPQMTTCARGTLGTLEHFMAGGGRVVSVGELPTASVEVGRDDAEIRAGVATWRAAGMQEMGPDMSGLAEILSSWDLRVEGAPDRGPTRFYLMLVN